MSHATANQHDAKPESTRLAARYAAAIKWVSILLILMAVLLLARSLPLEQAVDKLKEFIRSLGVWGPVVFATIYMLWTVLMLPGSLLTIAGGGIFGLWVGLASISVGSTAGAALAFLIARYLARARVKGQISRRPKLAAVDRAIGEKGWKLVALLRLSPAIPFNLQNYLYGVTSIRFWPYVLTSWLAMLPGTFLYVYIGYVIAQAGEAAVSENTNVDIGRWVMLGLGLLATVAVTIFITRIARQALREESSAPIDESASSKDDGAIGDSAEAKSGSPSQKPTARGAVVWMTAALILLACSLWALANKEQIRQSVRTWFGAPPEAELTEDHAPNPAGPTFDHSLLEEVLKKHVDEAGLVDYEALRRDPSQLDRYIASLARADFESLGRHEKLALLINAYNAFTLRLILDYYGDIESINDIPAAKRWDAARWRIGRHNWSLNQIEHEQIRPKFAEPRIHFALVCAAIGCPPLRNEAYTAEKLHEQLAAQTKYVHTHPRWFRYNTGSGRVGLTRLYQWYGGDFEQFAGNEAERLRRGIAWYGVEGFEPEPGSVLGYVAAHAPELAQARAEGRSITIEWLPYDWTLNDKKHRSRLPSEQLIR